MNEKLTYRLLIHGSSINGDAFSCTGEQAKQLISDLVPWTKSCRWFLFDVKTNNVVDALIYYLRNGASLSTHELQRLCEQSDQFLSGIFLALPQGSPVPEEYHGMITEDEPTTDIGGAVAELRAMDTSYFELYFSNPEIRNVLQMKYSCSPNETPG